MSPSVKTNCVQGIIPLKSTFTLFFWKGRRCQRKLSRCTQPLIGGGFYLYEENFVGWLLDRAVLLAFLFGPAHSAIVEHHLWCAFG